MLEKYKYTDSEMKELLSSIVVIIDTREKANKHIIDWFTEKKIHYIIKKLDHADYSFYLPQNINLGIERDMYFTNEISVERKGSLEELAGNFSKDRDRIEDEFLRHKGELTLLIEDGNYKDIWENNYKTKLSNKSYIGTLHSFSDRYKTPFIFVDKEHSARFIYFKFYYFLRNILK